ncbi:MAG: AI-2E family transporter, partial [Myxococcales bacterium]
MTPTEKYAALYTARFVLRRLSQVTAVLAVLAVAYLLRGVLVPLFLAFVIAYALDPLVGRVSRLGLGRPAAAGLVMLAMAGLGVGLLAVAIPYAVDEFAAAAAALPGQLRGLRERADPWLWDRLHLQLPQTWGDVTRDHGDELRRRLPGLVESAAPALFGTVGLVVVLGGSLIIPVFAFYLLMDLDVIVERSGVFVPRRHARQVYEIARQVHVMLGRYVRGQLTAC